MIQELFIYVSVIFFTFMASKSTHPIKISMILMTLSIMLYSFLYWKSGNSWISLILILLFTGGILVMMMILSSLYPNEKMSKSSKFITTNVLIYMSCGFMFISSTSMNKMELTQQIKWIIQSKNFTFFMVVLIFIYFFTSMMMIIKSSSPLRSYMMCY